MKCRGYMSIFFALSLLCICSLLLAMVETARMAGARLYLQTAVNSAMDSVFSQYHRGMWEQYRLLLVEYGTEEEAAADFKQFLTPYLEADSWYPMRDEETIVEQMLSITDDGGIYLEEEILAYMKYGIWNMDFQPEEIMQMVTDGKEAEAVHDIASAYRLDTRGAWKLEQALEQLDGCLSEQQKQFELARRRLNQYDGGGFITHCRQVMKQLKRIPSLVKTYENKADELLSQISDSGELLSDRQEQLSEAMNAGLTAEINEYRSYIEKDGERRTEIRSLTVWSEQQLVTLSEAVEAAEAVMETLDNWDSEDDPDLADLWEPVKDKLSGCESRRLSVSHGIKDKEKQNWLSQAENLFHMNLLSLVLPEGAQVSAAMIDKADFPSNQQSGAVTDKNLIQASVERLAVTQYCGQFFSDFRKVQDNMSGELPGKVPGKLSGQVQEYSGGADRPVAYELEYLCVGKDSDAGNLEQSVLRILLMREGWNLVHIFSDAQKRAQARELATAVVGATGLVPLVLVTAFFIMSLWALGEAIMDLRLLLAGKKVPLMKTSDEWQLSLEALLQIGQKGTLPEREGEGRGLTYESYLKVLLFFESRETLYYRMMDMIQVNICREQASFRMAQARYRLDIRETVSHKHVFLAIPVFQDGNGSISLNYQSQASAQKAY